MRKMLANIDRWLGSDRKPSVSRSGDQVRVSVSVNSASRGPYVEIEGLVKRDGLSRIWIDIENAATPRVAVKRLQIDEREDGSIDIKEVI